MSSSNRCDLLRLAAELVVEAQHLGHEPGTDLKRQIAGLARRLGAAACAIASRSNAVSRAAGRSSRACRLS